MSTDLTPADLEQPRTRGDLARQLLGHVERLSALLEMVPLATELRLLKRDLSRGHEVLRSSGEANFLSVVTLVESALACLTWKQYTAAIVDTLHRSFAAGIQEGPFTFADYDAIRRLFAERGIPTVPAIDLHSLEPEDLDDGQEG